MEIQEVILEVMKEQGVTQRKLAESLGYASQAGVAQALRGNSMRVDTAEKMLNAMGCEIIARLGDREWVIGETITTPERPLTAPKNELEEKIDQIGAMVKALIQAQQAEKTKKPSHGKIPLTQAGSIEGRYFDPSWFDPDNNSKK